MAPPADVSDLALAAFESAVLERIAQVKGVPLDSIVGKTVRPRDACGGNPQPT